MNSEIYRCDNGACYNEMLIEEQAIKLQKMQTEIDLLKSEYEFEKEAKTAYRKKLVQACQLLEQLYNLDTLDPVIDKQWIDECNREVSMFLQDRHFT